VLPPRNPAAALPLPGEQPTAPGEAAAPTGRFPWPVNGRVLATFGNAPGGGHNDGINIAAPRGTPVRAIEAGTVAYAGNEVKGYGNLLLIKHPDGWISAYAHLDEMLVKVGDSVSGGQVIAKVGNSGGVSEPQLHFELRRGKKPVDPREFLAPSPSAA
jgi:murein DD-endopeptidase MepM/ murein hydrolase activator NlpD